MAVASCASWRPQIWSCQSARVSKPGMHTSNFYLVAEPPGRAPNPGCAPSVCDCGCDCCLCFYVFVDLCFLMVFYFSNVCQIPCACYKHNVLHAPPSPATGKPENQDHMKSVQKRFSPGDMFSVLHVSHRVSVFRCRSITWGAPREAMLWFPKSLLRRMLLVPEVSPGGSPGYIIWL